MKWFITPMLALIFSVSVLAQTFDDDRNSAFRKYMTADYAGAAAELEVVRLQYAMAEYAGLIHAFILDSYVQVPDLPAAIVAAKNLLQEEQLSTLSDAEDVRRHIRFAFQVLSRHGTAADRDEGLTHLLNNPVTITHTTKMITEFLKANGDNDSEVLNIALSPAVIVTALNSKYISQGRANDPELQAIITQLTDGGAARPLANSAKAKARGAACDDSKPAGKYWKLFLAGSYQLAGQHAWETAKLQVDSQVRFKEWIDMVSLARKAEQQHFNDPLALDFAKWQNVDPAVPTNPLNAWLTP